MNQTEPDQLFPSPNFFTTVDELCQRMKENRDICLFLDTNIVVSYYENKENARKLVINNPDRCFVTPSVVKECVRYSPGPEFTRIGYNDTDPERMELAWKILKETIRIPDNYKTDTIILFEAGSLAPFVPDEFIIFPEAIFITQNMKFLRRCLRTGERRLLVQQAISQAGLENLVCAYCLSGSELLPFVQIGGGAKIGIVN
jgi:hypothetical protein